MASDSFLDSKNVYVSIMSDEEYWAYRMKFNPVPNMQAPSFSPAKTCGTAPAEEHADAEMVVSLTNDICDMRDRVDSTRDFAACLSEIDDLEQRRAALAARATTKLAEKISRTRTKLAAFRERVTFQLHTCSPASAAAPASSPAETSAQSPP